MKKMFLIFGAILSLMMAVGSPVSAQSSASGTDSFKELGVQHAYLRAFADAGAAQAGTPSADGKPMMIMTGVISFEDASKIKGHMDDFVKGFGEEFFQPGYKTEKMDNLGDEALMATGNADMDGKAMPATGVFARKGEYVFLSVSLGTEDSKTSEDATAFMVDSKPSTTKVEFSDDGTSTGGEFDMMPTVKDVKGMDSMIPVMDMDLMQESATPKA